MKASELVLVPNTYAYASTSNHLQPLAIINHNMFQIHVYIHWLLPKDRRYDLEDILWKERNNYA